MKCPNCGEYRGLERIDSKFCSEQCRIDYHRIIKRQGEPMEKRDIAFPPPQVFGEPDYGIISVNESYLQIRK